MHHVLCGAFRLELRPVCSSFYRSLTIRSLSVGCTARAQVPSSSIAATEISNCLDLNAFLNSPVDGAAGTLAERVALSIASVGENISVRRVAEYAVSSGVIGHYTHGVGTYVALVGLAGGGDGAAASQLADKLAQQVVAVDPGEGGVEALLASPYLFDSERTVGDVVAAEAPDATVTGYLRWGISDEISSD